MRQTHTLYARLVLVLLLGLLGLPLAHAAEPWRVPMDWGNALIAATDSHSSISPDGRRAIAAPTVLVYAGDGRLLSAHGKPIQDLFAEAPPLSDLLGERGIEVRDYSRPKLLAQIEALTGNRPELDEGRPTVVLLYPPMAKAFCPPCATAAARMAERLQAFEVEAETLEVELEYGS
jgi:hypothetical protein